MTSSVIMDKLVFTSTMNLGNSRIAKSTVRKINTSVRLSNLFEDLEMPLSASLSVGSG